MDSAYYINSMIKIWRLKGFSVDTVKNYTSHLKAYLEKFAIPESVTKEQRWDYFLTIPEGTHRSQRMTVVRQLHEYLLRSPIDWRDLPYTKKKEKLPAYFTETEVQQLIVATSNPKHKCFLAIQYLCGLRVREVLNIKLTDISTKENIIRINGKGSKQRELNIPAALIQYLKSYWKWINPKPKEYLFEGQYGGRYSARSIQLVLDRAKEKCGLAHKTCSTHGLRHAAATLRINKLGWNTRQVQAFLGHKNIKTTERYTHVTAEDFKQLNQPIL